jgi:hypothetical protein
MGDVYNDEGSVLRIDRNHIDADGNANSTIIRIEECRRYWKGLE